MATTQTTQLASGNVTTEHLCEGSVVSNRHGDGTHLPHTSLGKRNLADRGGWSDIGEFRSVFVDDYRIRFIRYDHSEAHHEVQVGYHLDRECWITTHIPPESETTQVGSGSFRKAIEAAKRRVVEIQEER